MRKIVWTFGLLCGGLITIFLWVMMFFMEKGVLTFDNGDLVGYASMIVSLSMIFFGIKSYRDRHQNGSIKFLTGLQIGLLISVIASLMYATGWEIYYQSSPNAKNNFMNEYADYCVKKMKNEGASEADIEKATKDMDGMKEIYKNFLPRFGITLMEIFPVGLAVSLICAGILRRKEVLPE
ncbi:DUF4199 domain-containing protein [bacterium]|nr:DUF4199 domain-containing protein [bacterium]